jgi:hypothetical protein
MNLNACIARIWNSRGEVCGTAFLVGEDRLLTCAHAAGAALDADLRRDDPQSHMLLDFPGVAARKFIRAEAIAWQQDDQLDYAVLAPLEPLPQGLVPPPLLVSGIEKTAHHVIRAVGFLDDSDCSAAIAGELASIGAPGQIQIRLVETVEPSAQPGFSGAPVIDAELEVVIGLVATVSAAGTAFILPLAWIAQQWPQLLDETFRTIQRNWPHALPDELAPHAERVTSPLSDPWRRFITKPGWHERLGKKLADIAAGCQPFTELQPLAQMATQVDLAADYETIRQQLQGFNQQRELASIVDQIITRYECKTLLSAGQIRGSRYNPSPDEEKQLALDNIRQNLNDLREAARTPEFGRCFFVLGDMGSGKTHFLRVDLPQSGQSQGSLVLDLQPMPVSGSFEHLLLANLRAASGINWPDVEAFDQFLGAYSTEFRSGLPVRLVIAIDDLGRWEQARPGFIREMVSTIRSTTQYHHLYWLICNSYAAYSLAVEQSADTPGFWSEYADIRNPDQKIIDHWLVLDELNRSASIGTGIIREGTKKHPDREAVNLVLSGDEEDATLAQLNNPLIALAFLNQTRQMPPDRAIHLKTIALLETYWQAQFNRLASSDSIEARFPKLWALRQAKEILSQSDAQHPNVEAAFTPLALPMRNLALEFYLLLLDDQRSPAAALACCDRVLASTTLPHAPVWNAGARSSTAVQKGLIQRARNAASHPMDGQALISLLRFIGELPAAALPVPERFALLQPAYAQIRPGGYAAYFYYVVEQLFKQLQSTDDLALSLIYLSGCEPTGLVENLANLGLGALLSFYDAAGPDSVFLARWLLDYLVEVAGEYHERGSIPGQEKGWRRTLFREFVLNSFLRYLCRKERLNTYTLLKQVHWYDDRRLRSNPVLALQKEREANIAIGALFRYDSKEGFIKFVTELAASPSEHDRRNAFYILRHSEHISDERPIPILDERFQPLLEKLFLDPALDRVLQSRTYYDLFRYNLRNFHSLERKRGQRPG